MAGLMKSSMMVVMMMIMVASMQMQSTTAQTRHVVGDTLGWTIPSNGAAAYTAWAAQQTFRVGDTLFFNFTTGMHNVAEVSQAAYGPCTTTNPISLTPTGPATITLTAAGTHYYICTVGTHCQIGQKLTINVTAPTTPPPAAAPTTPPPAASPTTPPPAATPTATPTPAPVSPPAATPAPATAPTTSPTAAPTTPPAATPTEAGASPPSPINSSPAPNGDSTPPPPSPSAAATTVVPATLLGFALALFF